MVPALVTRHHVQATLRARTALSVLAFITALCLGGVSRADDPPLLLQRHQAAGLNCASCHMEQPPHIKVANTVCLGCHGDQAKLAGLTGKAVPNPHAPPHLTAGETQVCDDCHHVHKLSEVLCTDCHHSFHFNVK